MKLPRFIPNWRQSPRFHVVRVAAVLAALSLAQADLLPYIQPIVSPKYWPFVTLGFAAAIWFFRVLAQQELHEQQSAKPQEPGQ